MFVRPIEVIKIGCLASHISSSSANVSFSAPLLLHSVVVFATPPPSRRCRRRLASVHPSYLPTTTTATEQQQQHLHLISMKQMAWQEKQWSVGRFVGNILVVVIVVSTRMWNSEKQTKREDSLTTTTFFGGGRTNGWTTTLARSLTHSLVGRFTSVGRRPRRIGSPHLFAIICIHKRNRTDLRNREKFPLCT